MSGYEKIRELAKASGVKIPDLLALARQNDPFFVGSPSQVRLGEWFADLWERFGFIDGVHLRRVHYRLVSEHVPTGANGKPYKTQWPRWTPTYPTYRPEPAPTKTIRGSLTPAAVMRTSYLTTSGISAADDSPFRPAAGLE